MKKVSLVILCTLIINCFAGWGAMARTQTVSAENEFPIVEEKVSLKIWGYQDANIQDLFTNRQTVWYEEKSNVHADWVIVPQSEMATMFNLSIASKDYPDIYWNLTFTPAQVMVNGQNGVFLPLNDLIQTQGYNYKIALEENPDYIKYLTAPDGNIYTFLSDDLGNHMMTQEKMFVYKPWLDKLNMELPTTTEEFRDMLQAFKDNDMNENGDPSDEVPLMGSIDGWSADPVLFLMNAFQLYPMDKQGLVLEDGKISVAFTQEEYREGLRYIKSLYDEGLLAEETFVQDLTQLKALVSKVNEDEIIVGTSPACWQGVFVDINTMPEGYVDYVPILPLEGPSGLRQTAVRNKTFRLQGVITTACEIPEVAFKWMDFWLSLEGTMLSSRGWEDSQYTWVDEPSIMGTTPSYTRILEGLQDHNDFWYGTIFYDTEKRRYGETRTEGGSGTILYEASELYLPFSAGDGWPSSTWATEEQVNEISLLQPTIEDYVKQSATQFIIGALDLDADWEGYIANLDAMGLQKYVSLQQEIIDAQ